MNKEVEKIFVDILKTELGLRSDRVLINDQNFKIPKWNGLYVFVGVQDIQPFSNNNYFEPTETGGNEIWEIQQKENIQIDILSKDSEARIRRWEVLGALNSIYSEQKQEEHHFKIFEIPSSFVNTSEAEGGSRIYRFSLIVPCLVWYRKTKAVTYYDNFDVRVDNENTIGQTDGLIDIELNDN